MFNRLFIQVFKYYLRVRMCNFVRIEVKSARVVSVILGDTSGWKIEQSSKVFRKTGSVPGSCRFLVLGEPFLLLFLNFGELRAPQTSAP